MASGIILLSAVAVAPATEPKPQMEDAAGAALALFILVLVVGGWFALRTFIRNLRARKAESAVGSSFPDFALQALVNAAKIDGRVNDEERAAIARAMADLAPGFDPAGVGPAFESARLNKDELVDYLRTKAGFFARDQKMAFLNALLTVFVADGRFDETEHAALVDYTAAVGFDRQSAPDMLRNLSRSFVRGSIT